MKDRPAYVLTIRDEPHGHQQPFPIRLRLALKLLLRGYGLRVVDITPKPQPKENPCLSASPKQPPATKSS